MQRTAPPTAGLRRRELVLAAPLALAGCASAPAEPPRLDVPYVPTPQSVVDKMLEMAAVRSQDVLYDLGCGDGRIVVTAASKHGARGVGVDIDPQRIREARDNALKAGVTDRVRFTQADLFASDFSPATVVTLYLLPHINVKLRPQLWRQLRVGTRIVSHAFDMGDWEPERRETVEGRTLYAWTVRQEHKQAVA